MFFHHITLHRKKEVETCFFLPTTPTNKQQTCFFFHSFTLHEKEIRKTCFLETQNVVCSYCTKKEEETTNNKNRKTCFASFHTTQKRKNWKTSCPPKENILPLYKKNGKETCLFFFLLHKKERRTTMSFPRRNKMLFQPWKACFFFIRHKKKEKNHMLSKNKFFPSFPTTQQIKNKFFFLIH